MDALMFQAELERLLEENRKLSSQEPTNQSFTIQIGKLLLRSKELFSTEEYQAVLEHCGITPAMENKAIEICKIYAPVDALEKAMQSGGMDAVARYLQGETEEQLLERMKRMQRLLENEQQ